MIMLFICINLFWYIGLLLCTYNSFVLNYCMALSRGILFLLFFNTSTTYTNFNEYMQIFIGY